MKVPTFHLLINSSFSVAWFLLPSATTTFSPILHIDESGGSFSPLLAAG